MRRALQVYNCFRNHTSLCVLRSSTFSTAALKKIHTDQTKSLISFNSQISENGRKGNIEEAESIFFRMPTKNVVTWTAMLSAYGQNGQLNKARELFDKIPQRTVVSWNAMLTAYMRCSFDVDEIFKFFLAMPERNAVSFAAMVTGFVIAGRFSEAEKLYHETPVVFREPVCSNAMINGYLKNGKLEEAVRVFENMRGKDIVSYSSMVDGYCKSGNFIEARKLFDAMWERNNVTWSSMMNGYMRAGSFEDGFALFQQMRREGEVRVEPTTLTIIFEACGKYKKCELGFQIHGLVLQLGHICDVFLSNSIITMYSRFGCTYAARSAFDAMISKDIVSWNSLISCYVQGGRLEEAYELFVKAPEKDVVSWTTLLMGFTKKGLIEKGLTLFKRMPEKDVIAWSSMISGFVHNAAYEEAFCLFVQMIKSSVRPNPITLCSMLSASAGLAVLSQGLQIHAHVLKMCLEFDLLIQSSLISMYSKCGSVNDAYRIFISVKEPNICIFNAMIIGFSQNGLGNEALHLFKELEGKGEMPNAITLLGVLLACTHSGMVEEGWNYFKSMMSLYMIEPELDHYAIMVDILGKAGLLDEAMSLIKSMPLEPHSGVWGALLSSSRTHLRPDLAKVAAEHIYRLEPSNSAPYVALSDMYSFMGQKTDEEQVRLAKRLIGIKKSPGCSWILLKNSVNVFLSGDTSHINFIEINLTLRMATDQIKRLCCTDDDDDDLL
ncbi:unnamed protein product [Cuscuta epithymum]|uniref:Uncharacterized protein n=1 Tax=Cuscuta epithymum TaxID=186058 RepID=A0AAV0ER99_9ASTE|nr:unnamed protein product [Cuscuta epithymum]